MKEKARTEAAGLMRNAERQIELETTRALQQIRQEADRHLDRHRLEAPPAERVEGRQRTPDRRNVQAARDDATHADACENPDIPNPKPTSKTFVRWDLGLGVWDWV